MSGMEEQRLSFVWTGLDAPRTEYADITVSPKGLSARGCQIGVEPEPYVVGYQVHCDDRLVVSTFEADSRTRTGGRRVRLFRNGDEWYAWRLDEHGQQDNGPLKSTGELPRVLDVDLGYSPVFNSTPVLRDGLHRPGAEAHDYLMAWVSVPDLTVSLSPQRYEPLARDGDRSVIRYTSLDSGFTARIWFDDDGFVVEYEDFVTRIAVSGEGGSA